MWGVLWCCVDVGCVMVWVCGMTFAGSTIIILYGRGKIHDITGWRKYENFCNFHC